VLSDAGVVWLRLDGATPVEERQTLVDEFNAPGCAVGVFLLSTRAGGVGINLTSANVVVLHDADWNPCHDEQACGRAHRMGQTRSVAVHRLVTRGTVDEAVLLVQRGKARLNDAVLRELPSVLLPVVEDDLLASDDDAAADAAFNDADATVAVEEAVREWEARRREAVRR